MEEDRIIAVRQWPIPKPVKELQYFLGFANFYRRFTCNFSSVAAPLTALLKGKPSSLRWTKEADCPFDDLKVTFTSAPMLHLPDLDKPFVQKVDASETGVGAISGLNILRFLFLAQLQESLTFLLLLSHPRPHLLASSTPAY